MSDRALATMGVNGLLGALEPLTRPIVLEHVIKGRVVGVDASIWLHNLMSRHALLWVDKGKRACEDAIVKDFLHRAKLLADLGASLLFVFDGEAPPAKSDERKKRDDARAKALEERSARKGNSEDVRCGDARVRRGGRTPSRGPWAGG